MCKFYFYVLKIVFSIDANVLKLKTANSFYFIDLEYMSIFLL